MIEYLVPFAAWLALLVFWLHGRYSVRAQAEDEAINSTIDYLVAHKYLNVTYDEDGEMVLQKAK